MPAVTIPAHIVHVRVYNASPESRTTTGTASYELPDDTTGWSVEETGDTLTITGPGRPSGGNTVNSIRGGTQRGVVIQGRDFSGIRFDGANMTVMGGSGPMVKLELSPHMTLSSTP